MPEFKRLFEELLKKSNLKEEELWKLIEEKKRRVGSGYLTDQGALFLVASDLGIDLEPITTSLTLKDLYIGADEVTLSARILSISKVKTFLRRNGEEGKYRRLLLFDKEAIVPLNLWDEKVDLVEKLGLKENLAIKVIKAYVRANLNGKPVMNLGKRGNLEILGEDESLPKVEDIAKDIGEISGAERNLVIKGILTSKPSLLNYKRKDGKEGSYIDFHLGSLTTDKEIRVVIWDPEKVDDLLNLKLNSEILLVNLRSKVSSYGSLELHGDKESWVEILSKGEENYRSFKILSKGIVREGKGGLSLSCLVSDLKGYYHLIVKGKALDLIKNLKEGDFIKCKVSELRDAYLCDEYLEKEISNYNFLDYNKKKIKDLVNGEDKVFLEVIALSKTRLEEFTAKDGSLFRKAELIVGDDTGECKIIGWRDLSELLININPGDRILLKGVSVREGKDKSLFLQLISYSSLEKL